MTVYLDMDGVLADFFGGLAKRNNEDHWKHIPDKDASIRDIQGTDFFYTLEPFARAKNLVAFVKTTSDGDWGICSSPLRGDRDNSAYWKRRWLEKHDMMPAVSNLIFTGMKEKFAIDKLTGKPNILIDDKPSNIERWIAKGGIGIRYQANEDDMGDLLPKIVDAVYAAK